MPIPNSNTRYTTEEIAARMGWSYGDTRTFLRLFNVPCSKAGNCYLWDASMVESVLDFIELSAERRK